MDADQLKQFERLLELFGHVIDAEVVKDIFRELQYDYRQAEAELRLMVPEGEVKEEQKEAEHREGFEGQEGNMSEEDK